MSTSDESSELIQTLTFSKWLHSVLVRPFGQLITQIVKMVYEALELEDIVIDLDLETFSKKKQATVVASKKRKLDYKIMSISGGSVDMRDSSQIAEEAIVVEKVKSAALSLCAPQKGCQKKNRAIPSKLSP